MDDITITMTLHPDGSISGQEGSDISGIISQLLANDQFIMDVARRVADLQPQPNQPVSERISITTSNGLSNYVLPRYMHVQTFNKAQIYRLVWGLKTHVAQILARADIDPAKAILMTDRELLNLRLMGKINMAAVKEKRGHIATRSLRFDTQRMQKAVKAVLASTLFNDDDLRIDESSCTITCSSSYFQKLAELMEQHEIYAYEVVLEA